MIDKLLLTLRLRTSSTIPLPIREISVSSYDNYGRCVAVHYTYSFTGAADYIESIRKVTVVIFPLEDELLLQQGLAKEKQSLESEKEFYAVKT